MAKQKIFALPELLRKLQPLRARTKIVFTNGCFDLIHRGHVDYLAKARSCGGLLVVGLNSDASVRRLKGPERPVCPVADRAAVLAALTDVDFVVVFPEDTPLRLIQSIRPDVLVKGADYSRQDVVGSEFVRSYGGRVVLAPLLQGRSTSAVIQKIQAVRRPYLHPLEESQRTLIVIPARYGSTRFPGKALADLGGKTVLERVFQKAGLAEQSGWATVIATDDRRILKAARAFGAQAVMTSKSCKSGSDRCAEAARFFQGYSVIVNLQGDEPFQPPSNIRLAVRALLASDSPVATLAAPCPARDFNNPNVAKVAVSKGRAIYFSRSLIPFYRDTRIVDDMRIYKHIGLYVYRRSFLLEFASWPATPIENAEKLEQLRILENGHSIAVAITSRDSVGIDTPADLARARRLIR